MISTFLAATVSAMLISKADLDIATRVAAGEARNQKHTAVEGVCNVIYNRYIIGRWGTISGVVQARKQFSALNVDDPNRPVILKDSFKRSRSYNRVGRICRDVFVGRQVTDYIDVTGGADHYYSGVRVPYWAKGHTPIASIGAFKFFRLIKQSRKTGVRIIAQRSDNGVRRDNNVRRVYPTQEDRRLLTLLIRKLMKEEATR